MSGAQPVWVSGATGLIGGRLLERLRGEGVPARLLTRSPGARSPSPGVEVVGWGGTDPGSSLAGCSAAVHLSGEPVFGGLPTSRRLERIRASRIESTRALVAAIARLDPSTRPRVLVCASAVGFYGDRGEELLDESAAAGAGFLADLCDAWEAAAAEARDLGLRVVSLRFGVVLSRRGGALALQLPIFRLGLGGPLGGGAQWLPWVHLDDAAALVHRSCSDDRLEGPVNVVAPQPVRQRDFARALGRVLSRPTVLSVPGFALRAALGAVAGEILGSRRLEPRRACDAGYSFLYPELEEALEAELDPT